ncbi:MAG: type II secretion system F family protein [Nitrosopumilus sp.]|nr:type II secretion system F family protein [Nitrosopumilus sp.]MDH3384491.1 type II secretion system F family protein [Nitrosopumilus sp.]
MSTVKRKKRVLESEKVGPAHIYAYKLLDEHVKFLHPKFRHVEKAIKESMMPIPYEVYVASMALFSLVSTIAGGVIGIIVALLVDIEPPILEILIPIGAAFGFGGMVFVVLQMIPSMKVKTRSSKLMEEIPHFIGYMSTLATSGLSLEGIFKAIAREESEEEIVKDSKLIVRNLDIMGMDLITAITDLIHRTPHGAYSELLEGAIITAQSGGDLKEYFNATAKVQLEEKKQLMARTTESLGAVAEIYTILLIVFPLLAVIMLSIMGIMSPSLGGLDLVTLINILTFAILPLCGVMMLVMMDGMVPKR